MSMCFTSATSANLSWKRMFWLGHTQWILFNKMDLHRWRKSSFFFEFLFLSISVNLEVANKHDDQPEPSQSNLLSFPEVQHLYRIFLRDIEQKSLKTTHNKKRSRNSFSMHYWTIGYTHKDQRWIILETVPSTACKTQRGNSSWASRLTWCILQISSTLVNQLQFF